MILHSDCPPSLPCWLTNRFRPLSGIMILHVNAAIYVLMQGGTRFRPLSGIMILHLIAWAACLCGMVDFGFRPLSGIMILHTCLGYNVLPSGKNKVSVPCRGLWFFTQRSAVTQQSRTSLLFPSPVGDYDSSRIITIMIIMPWLAKSFRPLSGIMILHTFWKWTYALRKRECFRPLSGIMILHYFAVYSQMAERAKRVSVPCRGLWFFTGKAIFTNGKIAQTCFRPLSGIMILHWDETFVHW